jgi:hypothetical protein
MNGDFNELAVAVFGVVLAVTLLITRWAAKRTHARRCGPARIRRARRPR